MYLARVYDKSLSLKDSYRILRLSLFEDGHSFPEIDAISVEDLGDIIGYRNESGRADEKLKNRNRKLGGK